jgi:hypothetical protein
MLGAESFRKEQIDLLAEQLFATVAEEPFDFAVHQHNSTVGVHQEQSTGGRVNDRSEERVEWLS